jgi:hypothetical protein
MNDWVIELQSTSKLRQLDCKETTGGQLILQCHDISIASGEISELESFMAFRMIIPKVQGDFSVIGIDY